MKLDNATAPGLSHGRESVKKEEWTQAVPGALLSGACADGRSGWGRRGYEGSLPL